MRMGRERSWWRRVRRLSGVWEGLGNWVGLRRMDVFVSVRSTSTLVFDSSLVLFFVLGPWLVRFVRLLGRIHFGSFFHSSLFRHDRPSLFFFRSLLFLD